MKLGGRGIGPFAHSSGVEKGRRGTTEKLGKGLRKDCMCVGTIGALMTRLNYS